MRTFSFAYFWGDYVKMCATFGCNVITVVFKLPTLHCEMLPVMGTFHSKHFDLS